MRAWGVQEEIVEVSRFCALADLLKELSADVPGVTEFVRHKVTFLLMSVFPSSLATP